MDRNNIIESGGFYFIHNFDSGNLGHVERVPTDLIAPSPNHKTNAPETPDYEFNMWTRPDCAGTEFENGNRTWFYFGIQPAEANTLVRLNLINLNKQSKMYNQGMAPVTRTLPGKPHWERIRDKPVHSLDDSTFTLTFKYRTADNIKATTFFAFTYPFSFAELQIALNTIDLKMLPLPVPQSPDDIYYYRECLIYSLEGRRVDLLTISSFHGISSEREERLKNLFPDNQERPFKFHNKPIIFMSARVHPGETPSSFVFNGFLNLLLSRADPIALQLRRLYVFKMVPFLNPDGVARGHYRTDTRGVNLNRVYLSPALALHPTVYASRALIRYYHFGCEKEDTFEDCKSFMSRSIQSITESSEVIDPKKKKAPIVIKQSDATKRDEKPKAQPNCKKEESNISGEASTLADQPIRQVFDLKLQEAASASSCALPAAAPASDIHLSTSEELNITGHNPLRPLRDTLKNSISLLMESNSSIAGYSTLNVGASNLKMGWCQACRQAINKLEITMPGITNVVPGINADMSEQESTSLVKSEMEYFCTNCFKRYSVPESSEEVNTDTRVSGGDSGEVGAPAGEAPARAAPASTGDATLTSSSKEDKQKSPVKQIKKKAASPSTVNAVKSSYKEPESGLFLYIDLHGHASKKGIFMYGNHFDDLDSSVECMLLPRIMSLNNLHFHFSSCNFTERNMYLKDRRDGMSREGSGRVAVLKATGLVRSYTLECNYNTGRLVNVLPPAPRDAAAPAPPAPPAPPKYTPTIFEEVREYRTAKNSLEVFKEINPLQVGRSLGASILDLTGQHPNSRIPCSEHRNLSSVRDWLRAHTRSLRPPQLGMARLRAKIASPTRAPLYQRSKGKVADPERKENTYAGAKTDAEKKRQQPLLAQRSGHEILNVNVKYPKRSEPAKTPSRTRYLAENEPKPKTLSTKRRNILAIRKPNSSKTRIDGGGKAKARRRSADGSDSPRASGATPKLTKKSFARAARAPPGSSSSDDVAGGGGGWEEVGTVLGAQGGAHAEALSMGGKRRPFPNASPSRLKKIRLKSGL